MPSRAELNATFDVLAAKAAAGERCPQDARLVTDGVKSALVVMLALAGRIRIAISGRNYRTVEILEGPHKGKTTAPDPHGRKPWKVVDTEGTRTTRLHIPVSKSRPQPSAPRPLVPYAGKGGCR